MEDLSQLEFAFDDGQSSVRDSLSYPLKEYDVICAYNDFNLSTIIKFIDSGVIKIPGFQRNYVWDISRASRLIESFIIGLPVPQIFLYEQGKNNFLVLDGQQRLMTLYYFYKKRFPKMEMRAHIRSVYDEDKVKFSELLNSDVYFNEFKLNLQEDLPGAINKYHNCNYEELPDQFTFDLKTVRCAIIKQVSPENDDSCIYEIFNRLNAGGISLTPQEIRMCVYNSQFYDMLRRVNLNPTWRRVLSLAQPDAQARDIGLILRGFAMLIDGGDYSDPMFKFLNGFSNKAKKMSIADVAYCELIFVEFVNHCSTMMSGIFKNESRAFSVPLYEAVFAAACKTAYAQRSLSINKFGLADINTLKSDEAFQFAASGGTAAKRKVDNRLQKANQVINK